MHKLKEILRDLQVAKVAAIFLLIWSVFALGAFQEILKENQIIFLVKYFALLVMTASVVLCVCTYRRWRDSRKGVILNLTFLISFIIFVSMPLLTGTNLNHREFALVIMVLVAQRYIRCATEIRTIRQKKYNEEKS